MPRLMLAEWILSLVMPRERAAATVGDLMESASGPVYLWVLVVRTFFGSLVRQMFAPAQVAIVAKDFVVAAAGLSARFALPLLFPVVVLYLAIEMRPQLAPVGGIAVLFGVLLSIAITLVVPWKSGRMVAERHPGKELQAFVVICAAALALSAISSDLGAPWNRMLSQGPLILLRWNEFPTPWNPVLMLISMILTRRRWLRKAGPPSPGIALAE